MTYEQVMNALAICSSEHLGCEDGCPYTMQACRRGDAVMKDALAILKRNNKEIKELTNAVEIYGTSARAIALHLEDYCDENLGYAEMIAEASRKAAEEIEKYENIKATMDEFWDILLRIKMAKRKEKPTLEELAEALDELKAETIKEFWNELKLWGRHPSTKPFPDNPVLNQNRIWLKEDIETVLRVMTGPSVNYESSKLTE